MEKHGLLVVSKGARLHSSEHGLLPSFHIFLKRRGYTCLHDCKRHVLSTPGPVVLMHDQAPTNTHVELVHYCVQAVLGLFSIFKDQNTLLSR
jgi:hypothetical protein